MIEAVLFIITMLTIFGLAVGLTQGFTLVAIVSLSISLFVVLVLLFEQLKKWTTL